MRRHWVDVLPCCNSVIAVTGVGDHTPAVLHARTPYDLKHVSSRPRLLLFRSRAAIQLVTRLVTAAGHARRGVGSRAASCGTELKRGNSVARRAFSRPGACGAAERLPGGGARSCVGHRPPRVMATTASGTRSVGERRQDPHPPRRAAILTR